MLCKCYIGKMICSNALEEGTIIPILQIWKLKHEGVNYFVCCHITIKTDALFHHWMVSGSHIQFSHSVVSDFLRPHGLQHTRLPCPSSTPGACSNSCPLSRWCHVTIWSSATPFSSRLQSFPESGSFLISQLFPSAKVLELQLQHQSFHWKFRVDFL